MAAVVSFVVAYEYFVSAEHGVVVVIIAVVPVAAGDVVVVVVVVVIVDYDGHLNVAAAVYGLNFDADGDADGDAVADVVANVAAAEVADSVVDVGFVAAAVVVGRRPGWRSEILGYLQHP